MAQNALLEAAQGVALRRQAPWGGESPAAQEIRERGGANLTHLATQLVRLVQLEPVSLLHHAHNLRDVLLLGALLPVQNAEVEAVVQVAEAAAARPRGGRRRERNGAAPHT